MTAKNDQKKKKEERVILDSSSIFFNAKLLFLMTFWLILIKYSNFLKRNKKEKASQKTKRLTAGWPKAVWANVYDLFQQSWLIFIANALQIKPCFVTYEDAQLFSDGADQKWFLIESVEILYYSHAKRFNISNLLKDSFLAKFLHIFKNILLVFFFSKFYK